MEHTDKNQDAEEAHLAELIRQAGEDARARRQKTLSLHFIKLGAAIAEAASRQKPPVSA